MKPEMMGDAGRKLLLIMRDHNKRLSGTKTELHYNLPHKLAIPVVEAMKGFVEDEEFRIFHKGTGQEAQTLFTATELQERTLGNIIYSKDMHPIEADLLLFRTGAHIKAD